MTEEEEEEEGEWVWSRGGLGGSTASGELDELK